MWACRPYVTSSARFHSSSNDSAEVKQYDRLRHYHRIRICGVLQSLQVALRGGLASDLETDSGPWFDLQAKEEVVVDKGDEDALFVVLGQAELELALFAGTVAAVKLEQIVQQLADVGAAHKKEKEPYSSYKDPGLHEVFLECCLLVKDDHASEVDNQAHNPPKMDQFFFILLLTALCSVSECVQRQYHFINEIKTCTEAQRYCREKYTDLATVDNINDMNELKKSVNDGSVQLVWIGLQRTDKLILIKENLTWSEALRYCRQNHVDLVLVHSEEIQRGVMNVVKRASTAAVWLGLHNYCSMNMWLWVSGEIVCYHNWAPGNGTTRENCKLENRKGAVQSGGDQRWISLPESHKLNFICSRY
ncbi:macrophage mannose receptor 1-like protein [Labeo rohita]|uniref:Macrophage mannose receptor 1-like protein n=1 Tax=Labeo rohita TaxID=84645 RepID=A0A498NMJ9_LABRO|nr:macrophage mannose receptor 1-like protein [Labeo rohita]